MIKRTKLKCYLILLFVFTVLSLCLVGATGVYQAAASYMGFDWTSSAITDCTAYLNLKLTQSKIIISISFLMIIICFISITAMFCIILIGAIRYQSHSRQQKDIKHNFIHNQKQLYDTYFTLRKTSVLYILCSVALITIAVHAGSFLSYYLEQLACRGLSLVQPLVILCLSFCSLLFILICWIIIVIMALKAHKYFEKFQQISEPIPIERARVGEVYKLQQTQMQQLKKQKKKQLAINDFESFEKNGERKSETPKSKQLTPKFESDKQKSKVESQVSKSPKHYMEYLQQKNQIKKKSSDNFFIRKSRVKEEEAHKDPLSKFQKEYENPYNNLNRYEPLWQKKKGQKRSISQEKLKKEEKEFLQESKGRTILGQQLLSSENKNKKKFSKPNKQELFLIDQIRSKYID